MPIPVHYLCAKTAHTPLFVQALPAIIMEAIIFIPMVLFSFLENPNMVLFTSISKYGMLSNTCICFPWGGTNMFQIHIFPAEIGDSFLIEVGNSIINHILIDCGTATAWKTSIYPTLMRICRVLDLVVITHIDRDHIGGAMELFSPQISHPLTTNEVWFNGLNQINLNKLEKSSSEERQILSAIIPPQGPAGIYGSDISFSQGITLSAALHDFSQPWNTSFQGKAISEQCPSIIFNDSVEITPILPRKKDLEALFFGFQNELQKRENKIKFHNSSALRDAFEYFCYDDHPIFIESQNISYCAKKDIPSLANTNVDSDRSLTNASSIGFVLEFQNHQALFLGDTIPEASIHALQRWEKQTGKALYFDAIKMPHHGSKRNCMELLDYVDSSLFIISSNGVQYDHPSPETIAKIVFRPTRQTRHIVFNYPHSVFKQFNDMELMQKYNYSISVANIVDVMEAPHDRTT